MSSSALQPSAFNNTETGRGHGLSFIFYLLEQRLPVLILALATIAGVITHSFGGGWRHHA